MLRSEAWSHPICEQCWYARHPKDDPARRPGEDADREKCCWCGNPTKSGIYEREDPWELPKHSVHALERKAAYAESST